MGYSLTIKCRNKNDKSKILNLLYANYKTISELIDGYSAGSMLTDSPSYSPERITGFGFDYGPMCSLERYYIYKLVREISVIYGNKFYYYDDEKIDVSEKIISNEDVEYIPIIDAEIERIKSILIKQINFD